MNTPSSVFKSSSVTPRATAHGPQDIDWDFPLNDFLDQFGKRWETNSVHTVRNFLPS
jgi:hypothetical protein